MGCYRYASLADRQGTLNALSTLFTGSRLISVPGLWHDTRVLVQLSSRSLLEWTPDDFASAVAQADSGQMALGADFAAAIAHDDRVRGVLSTRTLGMLGLPLSWDGPEPGDWYRLAPEAELDRLLSRGLLFGVCPAQVLQDGTLDVWHPRWLSQDPTSKVWSIQSTTGVTPIDPGAGEWVLFTPYGAKEPWQSGLWQTLALPYLVKRFALHDRARASEVFGSAMVLGTAPEGASEVQRKRFLTELEGLARSVRMVLPDGFGLSLIEAQGQTWGIYDQAITWADTAISVAIAGQAVTTEGQSGFSRGDIHEKVARSLVRFGAEAFSTFLGHQYIGPTWGTVAYPKWDIDPPGERLAAISASLGAFGDSVSKANSALAPYGQRVNALALLSDNGIPTEDIPGAIPLPGAPALVTESEVSGPQTDESIQALADKMTALQVDRCFHGNPNRCRICSIEVVRDLSQGPRGKGHNWSYTWRPIPMGVA